MNTNLLKYLASYQNVHNIRQTYLLVKYSREQLFRILAEWKKFLPKYVNKQNLTRRDYNDFLYLSFVLSVERLHEKCVNYPGDIGYILTECN